MGTLHFDCRLRYESGFDLEARFEAGGGVTALFGPSGGGKSTILALIAGTRRPREGAVRLADRTLVDTHRGIFLPPERRRIGVVFQDHLLFPHLTVRQNLRFGHGRRFARPMNFDRVAAVLEIEPLLDRRPDTLSGGQRQRVALGRALLRGPELLLMDEPLGGVDEALKNRILTYLERAVAEWRVPTLFVSHDQVDVRRLADRVVVVEGGKVVACGPTTEVLDRAVLTGLRGADGPVNLLRVTGLRRADGHWEGKVGEQLLHLRPGNFSEGGSALIRFLPHDVILSREPHEGLSARNRLRGVVREVFQVADRAFVALDAGQFLWAEVTPEAIRELGLRPGEALVCLIKTSAIVVLE
jgi:molybdate transport system ATP-binding protein